MLFQDYIQTLRRLSFYNFDNLAFNLQAALFKSTLMKVSRKFRFHY